MSREEAKQFLVSLGVEEPTEEAITTYLNATSKNEKAKNDLLDKNKSRIAELEAELALRNKEKEDIENANLSDLEKLQKQLEALQKSDAEKELTIKNMRLKTGLAEKGIVGEGADKLIDSLNKGEFDFDTLGQIIDERINNAVAEFEKKALHDTPNPNGGKKDETKPADVANAELLDFGGEAVSQDTKDYYVVK